MLNEVGIRFLSTKNKRTDEPELFRCFDARGMAEFIVEFYQSFDTMKI